MFPSINSLDFGSSTQGLVYPGIDSGIAQFEGFNTAGSVAQRNNNPGNIVFGNWAQQHGAYTGDSQGFAVFPDAGTGFSATDALVGQYAAKGYSLSDLVNAWNPPGAAGNSSAINTNYTNFLAQKTGVNPDAPISSTAGSGSSASWWDKLLNNGTFGILGKGGAYDNAGVKSPLQLPGFSWGRVAAFVLGMVLIAGGLLMFKPVQNVAKQVTIA